MVGNANVALRARSALILVTEGNHKLHWIKGHTGNNGNELVDRLCKDKIRESNYTALREEMTR
jgi:ribonuclease HI